MWCSGDPPVYDPFTKSKFLSVPKSGVAAHLFRFRDPSRQPEPSHNGCVCPGYQAEKQMGSATALQNFMARCLHPNGFVDAETFPERMGRRKRNGLVTFCGVRREA